MYMCLCMYTYGIAMWRFQFLTTWPIAFKSVARQYIVVGVSVYPA